MHYLELTDLTSRGMPCSETEQTLDETLTVQIFSDFLWTLNCLWTRADQDLKRPPASIVAKVDAAHSHNFCRIRTATSRFSTSSNEPPSIPKSSLRLLWKFRLVVERGGHYRKLAKPAAEQADATSI
jgi:hypothetical protein